MDFFLEKLSDPRFTENTHFLFSLKAKGIKLGLEKVRNFLQEIGNPHLGKKFIHIAGTNGKGSTLAIMEAVLITRGMKIGAFTSPHLITFQERFRINQQLITVEAINFFIEKHRDKILKYNLTFFEASTALAFWYFAQHETDYILLETGLGGRLDATNVVHAPIVAITKIGLDHTQFLGNTEKKIAAEKAGIIHEGSNVYLAQNSETVRKIIIRRCSEKKAGFHYAPSFWIIDSASFDPVLHKMNLSLRNPENQQIINLESPLIGFHQSENHQLALTLLLNEKLIEPDAHLIQEGLDHILWPGRLQLIRKNPLTYLDVGHNPDGFLSTLNTLKTYYPDKHITVIAGIVGDKDAGAIASVLEKYADKIILVNFSSERALSATEFRQYFSQKHKVTESADNVYETFSSLESKRSTDDIILIIGSHYLIGEFFLYELKNKKKIDYFYKIP